MIEIVSLSPMTSQKFGIGERQGEDTLLLEIRFMDSGKRLAEHGKTAAKAWLHGGVFSARALTDVLFADEDPVDPLFVKALGDVGVTLGLPVDSDRAPIRSRRCTR